MSWFKCDKHPKYKVLRKPRTACEMCWAMWFHKQGPQRFGWY